MAEKMINGTGRRKTAVARVYVKKGKGAISINGKDFKAYFPYIYHQMMVNQPLNVLDLQGKFDLNVNVYGGGVTAQAEAVRHGISRAFESMDSTNRPALKANGFLTRDSRMVERKKYGQRKARRRFQFSKR